MKLLVPTETEARILKELGLEPEIIGMGPVEAALGAYEILAQKMEGPVILAGIGGAYPGSGLNIGDLALATFEYFGDLGVCHYLIQKDFAQTLPALKECSLEHPLVEKAAILLEEEGFTVECGPFVTVCCATRDPQRGEILALRHQGALIENMEGFAVALAARRFSLPLIELRAVSNLISEPNLAWEIEGALWKLGRALKCLIQKL